MGGTSPVKRQKSLLFMLDKALSKCTEAHIFGRPQKSMTVPKTSTATNILKWKFRTTTLFRAGTLTKLSNQKFSCLGFMSGQMENGWKTLYFGAVWDRKTGQGKGKGKL